MDQKVKIKIQKLIALSQSDNENEASIARSQAKKMMAKHGISEDEIQIADVQSTVNIFRKTIKPSESILLNAISEISGCIPYTKWETKYSNSGNKRYVTTPVFFGNVTDAEIAAYCWDVIYSQLKSKQNYLKKQHNASCRVVDVYSLGWVLEASKKLVKAFGHKKITNETIDSMNKRNMETGRVMKLKSTGNKIIDDQIISGGMTEGKKANLHVGACNLRKNDKLLNKL